MMVTLNVRLPRELEERLEEEARRTGLTRSQLTREAIGEFLERRERARREEHLAAAARIINDDPALNREAREMAQDFPPLEDEVGVETAALERLRNQSWLQESTRGQSPQGTRIRILTEPGELLSLKLLNRD
ncbi:MAG: ribbon-helix-helix protein, CopG family [Pseudomonadota bacterium]